MPTARFTTTATSCALRTLATRPAPMISYMSDDGTTVTRLAAEPRPAGQPAAPEPPVLRCAVSGAVPVPDELPDVVWRAGIDLNPLDVANNDDVAWLEARIWPEQDFRRERLRQAIGIAREDPPLLVAGDLNERLMSLAGQAPADAALVVFHSAVMGYLSADIPLGEVNDAVRGLAGIAAGIARPETRRGKNSPCGRCSVSRTGAG